MLISLSKVARPATAALATVQLQLIHMQLPLKVLGAGSTTSLNLVRSLCSPMSSYKESAPVPIKKVVPVSRSPTKRRGDGLALMSLADCADAAAISSGNGQHSRFWQVFGHVFIPNRRCLPHT